MLSALFAALTAVFAKIGVKEINSDLATAIRTSVILFITWGIVLAGNHTAGVKGISGHTWIFLILSGAATGLSWLFYFKALQVGDVSRVAPIDKLSIVVTVAFSYIILKEKLSKKAFLGLVLIVAGTLSLLIKY